MSKGAGVLFLALDAADPDVFLRGAADGTFPGFASLLARGSRAVTKNPDALYVGAVWPSFWTSTRFARHGRYCFVQFVPGTYRVRDTQSDDVVGTHFWRPLSEAGLRVAAVDVPKCPPDPTIRGLQVVDWGTHDPDHCGMRVAPPQAEARVRAELGTSPLETCDHVWKDAADWERLCSALEERTRRREAFVARLLDEGHDAVLAGFPESHCVGHQGWHIHEPTHARHDAVLAKETGDVVLRVYRALDGAVGRLVERAEGRRVMLLLSHGMGPHYDGVSALDGFLERLEPFLPAGRRPSLVGRLGLLLDGRHSRRWNRSLEKRLGFRVPLPSRNGGRLAFAVPNNDAWAGVRVNLVGREPRGRVEPRDLDALLAALAARLSETTNGATGKPAFARILRTRDLHDGPETRAMPDLVAEWRRDAPIPTLSHPLAGSHSHRYSGIRTGDHREDGLVVVAGPGIEPDAGPPSVRVEDLGPTICAWLGHVARDVDGRAVPEWLSTPVLA